MQDVYHQQYSCCSGHGHLPARGRRHANRRSTHCLHKFLAVARWRQEWLEAKRVLEVAGPLASASTPPVSATPASSAFASDSWQGSFPPKLESSKVKELQPHFEASYPSEILDADNLPSARLLALVYKSVTTGVLKWVPWKMRMSQAQAEGLALARPEKLPRLDSRP